MTDITDILINDKSISGVHKFLGGSVTPKNIRENTRENFAKRASRVPAIGRFQKQREEEDEEDFNRVTKIIEIFMKLASPGTSLVSELLGPILSKKMGQGLPPTVTPKELSDVFAASRSKPGGSAKVRRERDHDFRKLFPDRLKREDDSRNVNISLGVTEKNTDTDVRDFATKMNFQTSALNSLERSFLDLWETAKTARNAKKNTNSIDYNERKKEAVSMVRRNIDKLSGTRRMKNLEGGRDIVGIKNKKLREEMLRRVIEPVARDTKRFFTDETFSSPRLGKLVR